MGFASATLVCPGELAGARREEAPWSRVGMCASRRRGCRVSCGRAARAGAGSLRSGSNSGPAPLSAVSPSPQMSVREGDGGHMCGQCGGGILYGMSF